MARKTRKVHVKGQSLIAAHKITPKNWRLTHKEISPALAAVGVNVKTVKKVSYLKQQLCISWWDEKGKVCCSFFSYRIFARWQVQVEKLISACPTLKEFYRQINYIQYDLEHYKYSQKMSKSLPTALEKHEYLRVWQPEEMLTNRR